METSSPIAHQKQAGTNATLLDVSHPWDAAAARRDASQGDLPVDVKRAAVSGLGIIAVVAVAVVASYVVSVVVASHLDALAVEGTSGTTGLLVAFVLMNVTMFGVTRIKSAETDVVIRLGLVHFVASAFLLALFRHAHPWPAGVSVRSWSPVAIWILLFGSLVPLRPTHVLGWATFAAIMDPFALMIRSHSGPRSASEGLVLGLSPFLAALIAYVTSSVVYQLNDRISKARQFGSYRLVERLGTGGMAEVWRAHHQMLARPAAIKLIRPGVLANYGERESTRLVRLFEREVQATAALRSPHTIEVYDFGVARDGTFYYVMELLNGFDLQTLVEQFGRQPPERVVFLLRQVCHSLHEAHARQFVHRDMKPGNIYVCRYGADLDFAKVLDFGLVLDRRPTEEELDVGRSQVGTPAVMAPEQIRFDAPVDHRTDIYAVGCVAYWLLTGVRVFEAETRADMLVMHAHQRPIPPSRRIKVDVPAGLEEVVMDCLSKNPDKRPETALVLSERLGALGIEQKWSRLRREAFWNDAAGAPSLREPVPSKSDAPDAPDAPDTSEAV